MRGLGKKAGLARELRSERPWRLFRDLEQGGQIRAEHGDGHKRQDDERLHLYGQLVDLAVELGEIGANRAEERVYVRSDGVFGLGEAGRRGPRRTAPGQH